MQAQEFRHRKGKGKHTQEISHQREWNGRQEKYWCYRNEMKGRRKNASCHRKKWTSKLRKVNYHRKMIYMRKIKKREKRISCNMCTGSEMYKDAD